MDPNNRRIAQALGCGIKWALLLAASTSLIRPAAAQQTYREQSTIDLFGNKSPIFNYMPNPGHVDLERLDYIQQNTDLREEEGEYKPAVLR